MVLVDQQVLTIEVCPAEGGPERLTGQGDLAIEGQIPAAHVPVLVAQGPRLRPGVLQSLVHVRLIEPVLPLEEDLGGVCGRGAQLIHPVPVQVDLGGVAVSPGQQNGISVPVKAVIVVDPVVQPGVGQIHIAPVGDHHAVVFQKPEGVRQGDPVLRYVLREGEHIPIDPRAAGGRRVLQHHMEVSVLQAAEIAGGAVGVPGGGDVIRQTVQLLRGERRIIGRQVCQGDGQHRLLLRVHRGDGGLFRQQVGHEPVAPVLLCLERHALRAVAAVVEVLEIEADGAALPLSGGEGHVPPVIGVPMGPVIGVVLRQMGEGLQSHAVGLRHGETCVLLQKGVHIRGREGVHGAVRRCTAVVPPDHLRPARRDVRDVGEVHLALRDTAVEQLEEVDVLRPLIQRVQKLVVDIEIIAVEELLIEIRQLVAGERASLFGDGDCLIPLGPGEGDGADARRQGQRQEQGRRPGLVSLGDAGDPVLQLPLACRHGGGGQQGRAGPRPHRDQGQQGFAVGDAFALSQGLDGGLVAGQLPVGLGDGGGDPHQGVEPVHRQAHAPQQRPQRVQMAGVGGLMGQYMPQPLRRLHCGGRQVNGRPDRSEQAGGGETRLHQIDGILAVLHGIGHPRPPELLPEPQIGHQEPHRHGGDADQPEDRQQVCRRHHPLPDDRVRKGFLPAGGRGRLPGGGAASLYLRCGGCDLGRCPHGRGVQRHSVNFPLFQPLRHRLSHRLRRRQDGEVRSRQAHRHQQPHQHQRPQGILGPAGNPVPEGPPQDQDRQDQHGRCQQDLTHVPRLPLVPK